MPSFLIDLAQQHLETHLLPPEPLKGDGSERKIYRFRNNSGDSWIGVSHDHFEENQAFLYFSRHFKKHNIPVPQVIAEDLKHGCYLIEDLGETTLADWLSEHPVENPDNTEKILKAYQDVLRHLPQLHFEGHQGLDYSFCHASQTLDTPMFETDIYYFQTHFWNYFVSEYTVNSELNQELQALTERVGSVKRQGFVSRDFQSRNIMWRNEQPVFIDYQSGGYGALHYDLATLLYASRSGINEPLRQKLIEFSLKEWACWKEFSPDQFVEDLYQFVLIRRLRSLGTYGCLPVQNGKMYFLDSIPSTLLQIADLLENKPALSSWQALGELFSRWKEDERLCSKTWLYDQVQSRKRA